VSTAAASWSMEKEARAVEEGREGRAWRV